ncbi:hypothetical protein [Microbulbifer sp. 2205BS26-8]|uniref:hypothetical protein n=1 Tax=Microbulbifer sp. 2205BS26-8 TaxID=3064386 RepID=UPI00273DE0C2|nr:hypothetical protein [Microbulbifer sp. 2205BS26-8]MDP5210931.1 hypothetical protein [Microbulbifer sp. 2205BS26-8]
MPLGIRIFAVYFLSVGLAGWFVLSTVTDEIRPGVRQSTKETLVDTTNLLAEILREEVKAGHLAQSHLPELLEAYGRRQPQANIWGLTKRAVSHRIYVTDASGRVLLDSSGRAPAAVERKAFAPGPSGATPGPGGTGSSATDLFAGGVVRSPAVAYYCCRVEG